MFLIMASLVVARVQVYQLQFRPLAMNAKQDELLHGLGLTSTDIGTTEYMA